MTPQHFSAWRSWLDLTQAQVASLLSINKRTVSVYETKGPIPRTVALACMAITDQSEPLDYRPLVEAQHPKISTPFLVISDVKRPSRYRGVYQLQENGQPALNPDFTNWVVEQGWNIRTTVVTLELPDTRRRDVAVMLFEDEVAQDAFVWRWR